MKKFLLLLLLISSTAEAFQYPYTLRSPKGLLMGDAFTAVNDDEYTLFYNPASMGRHKNDFTLYPFSAQASGSNLLSDTDRFKALSNDPVGVSDVLMNYPAHASTGVAPGLKMFNVGLTFFVNDSYDVILRNKAHPMLDLDLRSDRGILLGVGIPLGSRRLARKNRFGSQTSLGLSAKYIERVGLRDTVALSGTTMAEVLGQQKLDDLLNSFGQVKGIGWGYDLGLEHIIRRDSSQVIFGISALDVGGTEFKVAETTNKLKVSNIKDQVNLGLAAGQDFSFFNYIFSADVRGLNEQMEFTQRLRLGAQVGIPGLKFMGGYNSGYLSYGATLDLAFLRLTAGFYDLELGTKPDQIKSKRFIIYLSLFDFSFDA